MGAKCDLFFNRRLLKKPFYICSVGPAIFSLCCVVLCFVVCERERDGGYV